MRGRTGAKERCLGRYLELTIEFLVGDGARPVHLRDVNRKQAAEVRDAQRGFSNSADVIIYVKTIEQRVDFGKADIAIDLQQGQGVAKFLFCNGAVLVFVPGSEKVDHTAIRVTQRLDEQTS